MRTLFATLTLSLLLAMPTFAQQASPTPQTPASAPPAAKIPETNMKVIKDSAGKTDSYLIKDAPFDSDFVMGKRTAPLMMIEYASLSCPHCAHFSNTVLPALKEKYINTGAMRYILRQFPLNESALKGAELLDCVGTQDPEKYYIFAKVLFDAQDKWAFDNNYMQGLETIAVVGGLSREQFQRCTSSTDRQMKILQAKKKANDELHIPHTPYIFIGNEAYEGERSVEAMSRFIDAKLAERK